LPLPKFLYVIVNKTASTKQNLAYAENYKSSVPAFIYRDASVGQQKWERRMQLKSCNIHIKSDVFTATTFIEMEFYNPNNQEIEGLHRLELKPGHS